MAWRDPEDREDHDRDLTGGFGAVGELGVLLAFACFETPPPISSSGGLAVATAASVVLSILMMILIGDCGLLSRDTPNGLHHTITILLSMLACVLSAAWWSRIGRCSSRAPPP